ncbi:MAG: hypothetical protein WBI40_05895 [Methylococcaceae bacterium]
MKTFEELKKFIEAEGIKHIASEEDWESDLLVKNTFNKIIAFAVTEGVTIKSVDLAMYVENESKDWEDFSGEDEADKWTSDSWHYLNEILLDIGSLADKKQLPEKTQILHDFWHRSFYPNYFIDDNQDEPCEECNKYSHNLNAETLQVIEDARNGKNVKHFDNLDELFKDLEI